MATCSNKQAEQLRGDYSATDPVAQVMESADNRAVPPFEPGLVVDRASLVIDKNGDPWWVDPHGRLLVKAEAKSNG